MKVILFNKPQDGYFWLTNFQTGYPISSGLPTKINSKGEIAPGSEFLEIDGSTTFLFLTAEHLFQALKYTQDKLDTDLIRKIIKSSTPDEARKIGQKVGRKDWVEPENYRLNAMRFVLRRKFGLIGGKYVKNDLGEKLIKTGDSILVENAGKRDKFWGNGEEKNGINGIIDEQKGKNLLGKLLEEIRSIIRIKTESKSTSRPLPPSINSFPDSKFSTSSSQNPIFPYNDSNPKEEKNFLLKEKNNRLKYLNERLNKQIIYLILIVAFIIFNN